AKTNKAMPNGPAMRRVGGRLRPPPQTQQHQPRCPVTSHEAEEPRQRPQRGRRTRVDGLKHRDVQTTPVIEKEFPAHRRNSLKPLPTTSKLAPMSANTAIHMVA